MSLRRSVSTLLLGDLTNKALRLVAAIILARALPLDEFGIFNVGIAVSGLAVTATTLGLPDLGARDVAVSPERARWIGGRVVAARVTALLGVGLTGTIATLLFWPDRIGTAGAAFAMGLFMAASPEWLVRGLERMGALARCWILGGLTVALGSCLIAVAGGNATAALAAFAVAEAVIAGACWLAVRSIGPPELGLRGMRSLLVRSWPLGLSSIVVYSYYANVDTIILAATRSEAEAGLYSAAYRTFLVLNVVAVFAAYSVLPRLSREQGSRTDLQPPAYLLRALWLLFAYAAAVLGGAELIGQRLLELVYGSEFGSVTPTFLLLCTAVGWYVVGYPAGYTLIAADRNRRFLAGALVAGGLNLSLNLVLIPPLGTDGAAIATLAALAFAGVVWLINRCVPRAQVAAFVVALSALTASGIAAAADGELRLPLGIATVAAGTVVGWTQARRLSSDAPPAAAASI